jgi:hypothetical protein
MVLVTGCDGAATKVVGYEQGHCVSARLLSSHHLSLLRIQGQHKNFVPQMSLHHLCGSLIILRSGSHNRVIVSGYFSPPVSLSCTFPANILAYVLYFSLFSGCLLPFIILSYQSLSFKFSFISLHSSDSGTI